MTERLDYYRKLIRLLDADKRTLPIFWPFLKRGRDIDRQLKAVRAAFFREYALNEQRLCQQRVENLSSLALNEISFYFFGNFVFVQCNADSADTTQEKLEDIAIRFKCSLAKGLLYSHDDRLFCWFSLYNANFRF